MYLPKSKYKVSTARPGEYLDSTGGQYVGPIIETFTGAAYPGTDPMTAGPRLTKLEGKNVPELGLYNTKRTPTEAEYKAGYMTRFFVQDLKTQKVIEISPEAWKNDYKPNDVLRKWQAVRWFLTGYRATVQLMNTVTIENLEKAMPGIVSSQVLFDPLQFYKA